MARRRYRSENPNEELEDDIIDQEAEDEELDEELEGEDTEQDLEGEDIDQDAEDEDVDQDLDDEDISPDAEDEESTPKARGAKTARLKERRRCAGLNSLAKMARRLGVRFDASKAIANGTSLAVANARVLRAAAVQDSKLKVSAHRSSSASFSTKKRAQQMWKNSKTRGKK